MQIMWPELILQNQHHTRYTAYTWNKDARVFLWPVCTPPHMNVSHQRETGTPQADSGSAAESTFQMLHRHQKNIQRLCAGRPAAPAWRSSHSRQPGTQCYPEEQLQRKHMRGVSLAAQWHKQLMHNMWVTKVWEQNHKLLNCDCETKKTWNHIRSLIFLRPLWRELYMYKCL